MSDIDTYRVSTNQMRQRRWWEPGDKIPDGHYAIRCATDEEARLMERFLEADASFDDIEADRLATEIRTLMEERK